MALATVCPNCSARFRVAADQLKLRAGLARCGACRYVFDATATLSYVDDSSLSTPAPTTEAVGTVIAAIRKAEAAPGGELSTHDTGALPPMPAPASGAEGKAPPTVAASRGNGQAQGAAPAADAEPGIAAAVPAAQEAAAMAGAEPSAGPAHTAAPGPAEAIERPVVPAAEDESAPAPELPEANFLRDDPKGGRRVSPVLAGAGVALLALLLLGQLAVAYRAELLVRFPQARPALVELCRIFRCTVDWPARRELLAIVGTELQALPGTSAFELTAVVRNRGGVTLALPALELTLSDTLNRTVARKVFAPNDYLAGEPDAQDQLDAGLAAGADLTIRVAFEARGVHAAGFVVYPFYF